MMYDGVPKSGERISNFELRDNDIFIVSYPKTGTTWTIELVWTMINEVDIEKTKVPQMIRSPFLESYCLVNTDFLTPLGREFSRFLWQEKKGDCLLD